MLTYDDTCQKFGPVRTKITLIARWSTDLSPRPPEFNVEHVDASHPHAAKMSVYYWTVARSTLELNIEFGGSGEQ